MIDRGLVGVRQEDVGLGQHRLQLRPMVARAGQHDVEHGLYARRAGLAKQRGQLVRIERGEHQVSAHVQHLGLAQPIERDVLGSQVAAWRRGCG